MIKNQEFINNFIEEAKGHIDLMEKELLSYSGNNSGEAINSLFRAIHSIKGTAGFFGLKSIVELSNAMENIFGRARSESLDIDQQQLDTLFSSLDQLKEMVENVYESEEVEITHILHQLEEIYNGHPVAEGAKFGGTLPEGSVISGSVVGALATEEHMAEGPLTGGTVAGGQMPSATVSAGMPSGAATGAAAGTVPVSGLGKNPKNETLRVNVNLLNDLLNMAGEMVLGRNQLLRALEEYRKKIPGIVPILQNVDRITSGMQEKIMQTRMQPVGNVFGKFPRMIRDISKSLGKEIDLRLEGEEVELDKSMIEGLVDPLTHLVRNAADHGIEKPEDRQKAGKPASGLIQLKAYHEGGHVNIDIIDDGKGLDGEMLKEKALQKKLLSPAEAQKLTEQEMFQLIFLPGFSTAEQVTDISGRGVGMDVVKTNMEKLGGTVEIFSGKGRGTTIRAILPLTLAIVQSLIVEVEKQRFAIPQANIVEIVKIKSGDKQRKIEIVHNSEVLRLRGRLLPLIYLADALKLTQTSSSVEENGVRILVLKIGSRKFGLIVDGILGSEETLVKPLPTFFKDCVCYSGVTIMGDGKASMILDPDGLTKVMDLKFKEEESDAKKDESEAILESKIQNLLIFAGAGEENFAIDMSMVSRIEEIETANIQRIGEQEFIEYRGSLMKIIRPEQFLPLCKGEEQSEKAYVIVPKLVRHPIGIMAQRILDNVSGHYTVHTKDLRQKGIIGTILMRSKMVALLNIYELFEMADPQNYGYHPFEKEEGIHVLVVEDSPFFQSMEKSYFEEVGFVVYMAENGKQALSILEKHPVDVIVSDINMPVMDGYELIKILKEHPTYRDIPVIAVTALTGEGNQREGFSRGFDYYESKLDRNTLIGIIRNAVEERRHSHEQNPKLQPSK